MSTLIFIVLLLASSCNCQNFNEARFVEVVVKLESDAIEFRDVIEKMYVERRCDLNTLDKCFKANYAECITKFPSPVCPSEVGYHIPSCGGIGTCSSFYDFTVSNVRFPPGQTDRMGKPHDSQLLESICFSVAEMDAWVKSKKEQDVDYWAGLGFEPQAYYFGSHTGAFRIYPARYSEQCNAYDPRKRPWYVAGSSGRKNVVMVLDKSGSMQGALLKMLKTAAKRVLDTLTIGDRVGIIVFDTQAQALAKEGKFLFAASEANKVALHAQIDKLVAGGFTNFFAAFETAFDVLDATILEEFDASCNTAILFFTDGILAAPHLTIGEEDVLALVDSRMERTKELAGNKPIFLFTYSIAEGEQATHIFPHQVACRHELGVSARITDRSAIPNALSSYYLLFALGLGNDENESFAAWVEPYTFVTGSILGTTVSVPVYDRTKWPFLFLGVVAIDIALNTLAAALEGSDDTEAITEAIARLARRSASRCPIIEVTPCELEFYREATAGSEARCDLTSCSNTSFIATQTRACTTIEQYTMDIYANRMQENLSFANYGCCQVDEVSNIGNQTCTYVKASSSRSNVGASESLYAGICTLIVMLLGA